MKYSFFQPRMLLVATALAAGSVGAAGTTDTTPSATTTPEPPSRMSYAPCANLQGAELSDCLKRNDGARAGTSSAAGADAHASTGASTPDTAMNSNTSAGASTSGSAPSSEATISSASGKGGTMSPNHTTPPNVDKSASAANESKRGATAPRSEPDKTAAMASPVDNKFRADLRSCARMSGADRNSCLDRAIENHPQS